MEAKSIELQFKGIKATLFFQIFHQCCVMENRVPLPWDFAITRMKEFRKIWIDKFRIDGLPDVLVGVVHPPIDMMQTQHDGTGPQKTENRNLICPFI